MPAKHTNVITGTIPVIVTGIGGPLFMQEVDCRVSSELNFESALIPLTLVHLLLLIAYVSCVGKIHGGIT